MKYSFVFILFLFLGSGCSTLPSDQDRDGAVIPMANGLRSKKSEGQAFSLLLSLNTKKISQEKKIKLGVKCAVVANRVMDINSDGKPETIAAAHVSPNCNSVATRLF